MKKYFKFLPAILVAGMFVACDNNGDGVKGGEEETPTEIKLSAQESRAAEQVQGFNEDFFKAVVSGNSDANLVCSPMSASVLMSMVANAATGELSSDITKTLGCNDLKSLNSLNHKLLTVLPNVDPEVTFTAANGVWYDQRYTINADFAKVSTDYYSAPTYAADFQGAPNEVVKSVNGWVNEKTKGIIPSILNSLSKDQSAIIVNAIYYNGKWTVPFNKDETKEGTFYGAKGTSTVKMMHKKYNQFFCEVNGHQVVKMKAGNQNAFEVIMILPSADDIDAFIADADFSDFCKAPFKAQALDLYVPKMKFEQPEPTLLNSALTTLGIKGLASGNQLQMFNEDVHANHYIYQKTGIEFTEEGAEAAAVTWDTVYTSNGQPSEYKEVRFDHPFVFLIREATTGAILFAGKISDL